MYGGRVESRGCGERDGDVGCGPDGDGWFGFGGFGGFGGGFGGGNGGAEEGPVDHGFGESFEEEWEVGEPADLVRGANGGWDGGWVEGGGVDAAAARGLL